MSKQIELERVGEIPPDADIRHYDELGETAKHRLAEAVGSVRTSGEEEPLIAELGGCDCDIVKFTEYYQLGCS